MATAVATRRRIERLEGRLCPVTVPADPTTLRIVRHLWLRPGEIREAITRALRRNRGRGGLSAAVVDAYLYGFEDLETGPLMMEHGLPRSWAEAIWLADQTSDGEYVGACDDEYIRIRVCPDRVLVRRDGEREWTRWDSVL